MVRRRQWMWRPLHPWNLAAAAAAAVLALACAAGGAAQGQAAAAAGMLERELGNALQGLPDYEHESAAAGQDLWDEYREEDEVRGSFHRSMGRSSGSTAAATTASGGNDRAAAAAAAAEERVLSVASSLDTEAEKPRKRSDFAPQDLAASQRQPR